MRDHQATVNPMHVDTSKSTPAKKKNYVRPW